MSEENFIKNKELYIFRPFLLDAEERLLYRNNTSIPLAGKTFDLLLTLLRSAGHLQNRDDLIKVLWPDTVVEESNLTWNVNALRKALDDNRREPRYIETVRGHGYRFIAAVETRSKGASDTELASPGEGASPRKILGRRARLAASAAMAGIFLAVAGLLLWHFSINAPTLQSGESARSIAVLPFENLSPSKANAYFAGGIQDTILTKLSGIGDLHVISRTSTQQYPSHPQNLKEVGKQLGVTSILEGSVQKAGNQVLINVQLIDARTDNHIWAQAYTRTLDNVFDVENDVAEQVTAALKAKLLPSERARISIAPTKNPQAYDLFLKAGYFSAQVTDHSNAKNPPEIVAKAVSLYKHALRLDPNFALAWARLSYLRSYAYWYALNLREKNTVAAERAAKRALALQPNLPQAHVAMGFVEYYIHRNYAAALNQFDRARQNLPNNASVIAAIAYIHRRQGELHQTLTGLRKAATLDPHNPRWPYNIGLTLMSLRKYTAAEQQFDLTLAIEPYYYDAYIYNTWALLLDGKKTQARKALDRIPNGVDRQGLVSVIEFQIDSLAHKPAMALKKIKNAPDWVQGPNMVGEIPKSLYQAEAWAQMDNKTQARQAYEKAARELKQALQTQPDNPDLWSSLGLAEAGLDKKKEAIRDGNRATSLLSTSQDAVDGPLYAAALAKIYVRTEEPRKALIILKKLLSMPTGLVLSISLLETDPVWNPLRADSRFQELLSKNDTVSQL